MRSQVGPHPTVGNNAPIEGMKECHWLIPTSGGTDILFLTPATCHPFHTRSTRRPFEPKTPKREGCVRAKYATARDAPSTEGPTQRSKSGLVRRTRRLSCLCASAGTSVPVPLRRTRLEGAISPYTNCQGHSLGRLRLGGRCRLSAFSRCSCRRRAPNTRDK